MMSSGNTMVNRENGVFLVQSDTNSNSRTVLALVPVLLYVYVQ